ncbi:MAG TPA: DNA internalization-related competence protein ComEC/Rec2, partial [Gammaproteobacteria bacterium]
MRSWTIALLIGVVLFQQQATPPSQPLLLLLLAVALALLRWWRFTPARLLVALLAGFLWSGWHAQGLLAQQLHPDQEGVDITLTGWVASLPVRDARRTRFRFEVATVELAETVAFPEQLSLSWYNDAPPLQPGDRCRFVVRLKRPWGSLNPGGFDYEQWLFRQGVRATGYVRSGEVEEGSWRYPLQRLRAALHEELTQALEGRAEAGILIALAMGEQQGISKGQWQVFAATGTTHLISVSGLHVTLVAGLVFFLARWLWSRSARCTLHWPAPRAAAVAALLAALLYTALAGFAVPVLRSLVMVTLVLGAVGFRPRMASSRTLALALLAVLLLDPLEVLGSGLWLSFGSVALLLFAMQGRLFTRSRWWRWGRVHWVAAFGLLPLMALFFQQTSVTSPLANAIAVPWVGVVVVPLSLAGTLLTPLLPLVGKGLLSLAAWALALLWPLLEWLAHWQPAVTLTPPAGWTLPLAALAILWLLAPRGWPLRWLGALMLLPLLLLQHPRPAPGEVWFTLLDVGQGLASVVETRSHVLVFDTGLVFSSGNDSGSNTILPFLRHRGRATIDTLVVSHGDSDHIGGMASLLALSPVERLLTSVPDKMPAVPYETCSAGQTWLWDGVTFEILHPQESAAGRGNDDSCVLRVSSAGLRLLLTGDIERRAEGELLERVPQSLQAELLVAPHHGSKTSSTAAFIAAVAPRWVLFPTGYRTRYRCPAQPVVTRYRQAGISVLDTASSGAITVHAAPGQGITFEEYRKIERR